MFSHDNVHYLPEERKILSHHIHVVENFGPDLPLQFKLHEIWSVGSQEKLVPPDVRF